jgi:hypothetical protein
MSKLSEALRTLGACDEKVQRYAAFGGNYVKALKSATYDDLAWVASFILPDSVITALKFSSDCDISTGIDEGVSARREHMRTGCYARNQERLLTSETPSAIAAALIRHAAKAAKARGDARE